MKNQNLLGFGMIAAAIVAGGALVGRAGDVNPPVGPVQPTMHTLEEIYQRINGLGAAGTVRWKYWYRNGTAGTVVITPSQGVLHGVVYNPCNGCSGQELFDGNTTDVSAASPITLLPPPASDMPPVYVPFDIEFTHGLVYRSVNGSGAITVIYSVDQ